MYLTTFAMGSALTGLTGALYAPAMQVTPEFGTENFLVEAFTAVVVGGPSVLIGTSRDSKRSRSKTDLSG